MAAALLHGPAAPPLYDGIIVPPEPYRWVSPPANVQAGNKPPLPGEQTFPVQNGQVAGGGLQTGDNQVVMFFGPGAFKAPPGAQSVTCTMAPMSNPPPPPSGSEIRGNLYRVGCVAQPGAGLVTVASVFHLTMRFPPGAFQQIQFYDGTAWHALKTNRAPGGDPYASVNGSAFGDYAATAPTGAPGDSIFTVLGRYVEFYGILAFVLLFGAIAVIQELRRRGHRKVGPPSRSKKK
jgi:hypothetical protein